MGVIIIIIVITTSTTATASTTTTNHLRASATIHHRHKSPNPQSPPPLHPKLLQLASKMPNPLHPSQKNAQTSTQTYSELNKRGFVFSIQRLLAENGGLMRGGHKDDMLPIELQERG